MIPPFVCPVCDAEEILEVEYLPRKQTYLRVDGAREQFQTIPPPLKSEINIPETITKFFCGRCGYDLQDDYTDPDDFMEDRNSLIEYLEDAGKYH